MFHRPAQSDSSRGEGKALRPTATLTPADLDGQLQRRVRREIAVKRPNNVPRWITMGTDQGSLHSIAVVMKCHSRFYMGKLPPEQVADVLVEAGCHRGSCAEYLHNTSRIWRRLESMTGISGAYKVRSQSGSRPPRPPRFRAHRFPSDRRHPVDPRNCARIRNVS